MVYIRVYCLLQVPCVRFEMLHEVNKSVSRSCPSHTGSEKSRRQVDAKKTEFTVKVRPSEKSLRFDLTLAATLSFVDVKPTNWEISAFC